MSTRVSATASGGNAPAAAGRTDLFRITVFLMHAGIIGYVASGWATDSEIALLAYVVLLPLIVLQWLLNRGTSVISNLENLARTGRWRDPHNGFEGAFFRTVLNSVGVDATRAQINTGVIGVMFILWVVALVRMVEIVGS